MKKMTKVAFILASAITLGSLVSCDIFTEPAYEKIDSVSELKVKAYPGMNILTWKPSDVTNGYVIYRQINGGDYICISNDVDVNATKFKDTISILNEWKNGDEIKYLIQNKGQGEDNLGRAVLSKIVADSSFAEATVKGINLGYNVDVLYRIPPLEEGETTPNFEDFDYSNPDEIVKLVPPTANINYTYDNGNECTVFVSFVDIPYLSEKICVKYNDNGLGEGYTFSTTSINANGNTVLTVPLDRKYSIWAEISQSGGYSKSVELYLGSVGVGELTEGVDEPTDLN